MKIKKLKLAFCVLAAGLCFSLLPGKALANIPSCLFTKDASSSSRTISPAAVEAYYTKRVKEAFPLAKKNGLVSSAHIVAKIEKTTPANILTIPFFESTLGHATKNKSFVGVMQIRPDTFLEMIARHGRWAAQQLTPHDPAIAAQLKRVAPYITYDKGETSLSSKKYKARFPKATRSLKDTALALREEDTISMLLAVHDSKQQIERFKKKKPPSPLIKKLSTRTKEDFFITRIFHNWGSHGGSKVLSHKKTTAPLAAIVCAKKAGWGNTTVAQYLEFTALSYKAVSQALSQEIQRSRHPKKEYQEAIKKKAPTRSTSCTSFQTHTGKGHSAQPCQP